MVIWTVNCGFCQLSGHTHLLEAYPCDGLPCHLCTLLGVLSPLAHPWALTGFEMAERVLARLFLTLCCLKRSSSICGNGSVPWPVLGFLWIYHLPMGSWLSWPSEMSSGSIRLGWLLEVCMKERLWHLTLHCALETQPGSHSGLAWSHAAYLRSPVCPRVVVWFPHPSLVASA